MTVRSQNVLRDSTQRCVPCRDRLFAKFHKQDEFGNIGIRDLSM